MAITSSVKVFGLSYAYFLLRMSIDHDYLVKGVSNGGI